MDVAKSIKEILRRDSNKTEDQIDVFLSENFGYPGDPNVEKMTSFYISWCQPVPRQKPPNLPNFQKFKKDGFLDPSLVLSSTSYEMPLKDQRGLNKHVLSNTHFFPNSTTNNTHYNFSTDDDNTQDILNVVGVTGSSQKGSLKRAYQENFN